MARNIATIPTTEDLQTPPTVCLDSHGDCPGQTRNGDIHLAKRAVTPCPPPVEQNTHGCQKARLRLAYTHPEYLRRRQRRWRRDGPNPHVPVTSGPAPSLPVPPRSLSFTPPKRPLLSRLKAAVLLPHGRPALPLSVRSGPV